MAITILEVLGDEAEGVRAKVRHDRSELTALLLGDVERALSSAEPVLVELDCERIVEVRPLPDFADEDSGIWQETGNRARLRGRVCQVIEMEKEDDAWVDLYLQSGPEFFLFKRSDVGLEVPAPEQGLELVVEGLRFLLPSS